jgi:hypothetical protein
MKILTINELIGVATVSNTVGMGNVTLPADPASQYDLAQQVVGSGDIERTRRKNVWIQYPEFRLMDLKNFMVDPEKKPEKNL